MAKTIIEKLKFLEKNKNLFDDFEKWISSSNEIHSYVDKFLTENPSDFYNGRGALVYSLNDEFIINLSNLNFDLIDPLLNIKVNRDESLYCWKNEKNRKICVTPAVINRYFEILDEIKDYYN